MNKSQQIKYESLYRKHVNALKRQGKADSTIDVYARAVRRVAEYWDCCPDKLTVDQLETHFDALIASHSWSTVKIDRSGLQFFYEHVLKKPWTWVTMVKPPQVRQLPDILSLSEIERLFNGTRELRYQTFILTAFSMGLRLGEVLTLQVGDIDSDRMKIHVRCGKGSKDRLVTLPQMTLLALREYWKTHRHPKMLFPTGRSSEERRVASEHMDRGGVQKSIKIIAKSCGIRKNVTPHTLRHCYGALLVEAGVNLRAIQHEMGHERPNTTALYTQLTEVTHEATGNKINQMLSTLTLVWGE
jgi:site-specific recombinase XerD